jgi:hypothetical protein
LGLSGFATSCATPPCFVPASYQSLGSQAGNFPVFEGTSLYALRIDHNINSGNRLTLRVNASPSTVTGIEGSGQDQPFGQNAYSRTSQTTYRDVAGVAQDTWTMGASKVNEFRFQYARRGLNYFYNTQIAAGADPAVNIPGYGYFGREPYSYIAAHRNSLPVHRQFFLEHRAAQHEVRRRLQLSAAQSHVHGELRRCLRLRLILRLPSALPHFECSASLWRGTAGRLCSRDLAVRSDSFTNIPIGAFLAGLMAHSP